MAAIPRLKPYAGAEKESAKHRNQQIIFCNIREMNCSQN